MPADWEKQLPKDLQEYIEAERQAAEARGYARAKGERVGVEGITAKGAAGTLTPEKPFERDSYVAPPPRGQNATLVLEAVRSIGGAGATYTELRHRVLKDKGVRIAASSMGHALDQLLRSGQIERTDDRYRLKVLRAVDAARK
jgi:hypothetical protein